MAQLDECRGNLREAETQLVHLLSLGGQGKAIDYQDAAARYHLAMLRINCGRVEGVGILLRQASRFLPAISAIAQGALASVEGRHEEALRQFAKAESGLASDPRWRDMSRLEKARAHIRARKFEASREIVGQILKRVSHGESENRLTVVHCRVLAAEASLGEGHPNAAERAAKDALAKLESHQAIVLGLRLRAVLCLAVARRQQGDFAVPIHVLEVARKSVKDSGVSFPLVVGDSWAETARALKAQGRKDEAITSYEKSLRSYGEVPSAAREVRRGTMLELATYLESLGRSEEALEFRKRARRLKEKKQPGSKRD
jgi:tetratricopeptide (TPR) repeat protein